MQNTAFYRSNQAILLDFSTEEISSDGSVLLLEKLECRHKLIKYFSNQILDNRHSGYVLHDVKHLKHDPLYKDILKRKTKRAERAVHHLFVSQMKKHRHFIRFRYTAQSWGEEQNCYAKLESTGKGLNVRYFISNIEKQSGRKNYLNFYVKQGEHSENRIKEVKNMCFSDRLSNHNFGADFFRLLIRKSCLRVILDSKTSNKENNS